MPTLSHKRYYLVRESKENKVEHTIFKHRYAGFWMRLWAFLLDLLAVLALNGILVFPLIRILGNSSITVQTMLTGIVFFLYFALMTKIFGQTIGKMVFGLVVISKDEEELTWQQVFFREGVGRLFHHIFAILYILYLFVAFTSKKQGVHDLIADTYVVHEWSLTRNE